jgi:acid phosphatase type 7
MMKKLLYLILPLFFIAVSGKTQENFYDTVEIQTADEPYRLLHGPYLQHLGETGVTFVWITNREGIGWIELAPDDGTHFYQKERPKIFASSHGLKNVSSVHTVRIENLKPGTKYRYRAFSQEVTGYSGTRVEYGNTVATNVYRSMPLEFVTNDHTKSDINFLMLTDIHGNDDVMESLLGDIEWDSVDLVFFNGDMYGHLESQKQLFDDFMDTAVNHFASETPMYYARGNHEARGNYAHNFFDYFPSPSGDLYYMFRQGPVSFLVFDSGEDKPDSDIEYYGITAFDEYMDQQAEWLSEIIKDEDFLDSKFKVVVIHIPPYHPWHGARRIHDKLVPILNEIGINVMLCGHRHRVHYQEATDGIAFPVLENAHNTILNVKTEGDSMILNIIDLDGKVVENIVLEAK